MTSDESAAGKTLVTRHSSPVTIDGESGAFTIDTPRTAGGFAESGAHQAGPLRFEIAGRDGPAPQDCAATVWISSLDGKPIESSSHLLLTHLTDIQNSGIEYADASLTTLIRWGSLPHIMRRGAARIELSLDARRSAGANDDALRANDGAAGAANDGRGKAANDDGAPRQMPKDNNSVVAAEGRSSLPLNERHVIAGEAGSVIDGGGNSVAATVYRLSSSGKRLGEVPTTWDAATGRLSFTARTDWDSAAATYLYEIVRD